MACDLQLCFQCDVLAWPLTSGILHCLQVSLDGGPLEVDAVLDPASGRPVLRQQLLLGTCGPAAAGGSSVTAELSVGLQRILLLSQAVAELYRQQKAADIGHSTITSSCSTAAAVQSLVQVGHTQSMRTYNACCTKLGFFLQIHCCPTVCS